MPKYNDLELNNWYRAGADFTLTYYKQLLEALPGIKHKYKDEARVLVILLWTSAARPNEVLKLLRKDIKVTGENLKVMFTGSKGSNPRELSFPLSCPEINEAWLFAQKLYDWQPLFPHFVSKCKIPYTYYWKNIKNQETGKTERIRVRVNKEYPLLADKLQYWFKKWGLRTPYYYRHNRMTIAAEDLGIRDLQQLKGAKKENSVYCYLRSTAEAKKRIGKTLIK
jgi:hypothetical protein